eukprot:CAMPEP_0201571172 /NCGR_PEP_ID=MMETSP0190_2-20130828/13810_1 /ASSEMBLY_ACC=CAM_ASM_000263 /TAXON_ID=37353 /ORGANISM="Rosalina sp." /LENGTH=47 /DNA_ID= /DNA_START= /DNA_END= /DNA_ORIENTATION=
MVFSYDTNLSDIDTVDIDDILDADDNCDNDRFDALRDIDDDLILSSF